jgi:CO/xanthine dehydrogenase Mo-binding subunit
MEDVTVYVGDSALTPLAGTTTATRLLYMSGNATKKAATAVRHSLVKKAADLLDVDPEELAMGDRQIYSAGDPDRAVALERVVKACAADGIPLYDVAQFNAPARELIDFQTGQGQVFPDFTFGTQAMEVSVDIETGAVKVLKIVSCYDVGQAINTLSAEGQLHGGALYGLGYGMMEEVVLDKGNTLTPSFAEYLIPSAVDVPDVKTIMIESGGGVGPFGAKGLGEPSCVPAAAAFANAVSDAIGARVCDLPVTPERILKALGRF